MHDVIIPPVKTPKDPALPPAGLLFLNPFEATRAASLARKYNMQEHHLFNSRLFSSADQNTAFFVAGPAVGAPMAVLCLEKLIACGARTIIAMGWCGALQRHLAVGDLILPTWAQSEEGTSGHYPLDCRPTSDADLGQELAAFLQPRFPAPVSGPLWTTDAPYRETQGKVKKFQKEGLLAVDMEFAALCAVAAFRGIGLAALMLVSDLLFAKEWLPGFNTKHFKRRSRHLVEHLFDFCVQSPK
jgi:uridine phosphorylase